MSAPIAVTSQPSRRRRAHAAASWMGTLVLALLTVGCSSDGSPDPSGSTSAGGVSGGIAAGGDSAGGGLPAGGNAGAGGPMSAMWTTDAGKYSLSMGSTYLELDPGNGARMTALRVGGPTGPNLLADSSVTAQDDNWGSTFWPSPQKWAWPPTDAGSINAINTLPYAAVLAGDTLTLTGEVNATAPTVSVTKKFSADLARLAIVIDYTMTNGGTGPVTVAPWEISASPAVASPSTPKRVSPWSTSRWSSRRPHRPTACAGISMTRASPSRPVFRRRKGLDCSRLGRFAADQELPRPVPRRQPYRRSGNRDLCRAKMRGGRESRRGEDARAGRLAALDRSLVCA